MNDELMYQRVVRMAVEWPWAILPGKLAVIRDLLAFRAGGGRLTAEEIRQRLDSSPGAAAGAPEAVAGGSQPRRGGVAVLPLYGTIIPRANMLTESSGAISTERFGKMFRAAMADPEVGSVVIDVDSPGGSVYGVEELASEIYGARGQKPITAVAQHLMASAAYWIGSAADELVVSPSGEVGSIGVLAMHEDWSGALEMEGIGVELVSAGKYKVEGNPFGPLDDEARGEIQRRVDEYYDSFVKAVAKGRGVKVSDVRNGFGEGRVVGAREAVRLGMADRVGTLDETISRLAGGGRGRRSASAELDFRRRRLRAAGGPGSVEIR